MVTLSTSVGPGTGAGPMVQCRVTDAGPGFRKDQVAHVFERFERASDSGEAASGCPSSTTWSGRTRARSTRATIPPPAAPR